MLNSIWIVTQIQMRHLSDLKPAKRQIRTHSRKQHKLMARAIELFGFINPIVTDADGNILAGHCRYSAAKLLGLTDVPTIQVSHLTDDMKRAYALADNKLAELAGLDGKALATEFKEMIDLKIDIEITGYSMAEVDNVLQLHDDDACAAEETIEEPAAAALPITGPGDVWVMEEHRLKHGSALDPAAYEDLMQGKKASAIFTDPPYNVRINGYVSGRGQAQHREFTMASGEMSAAEFTGFLTSAFQNLAQHSTDGSIHYICMGWPYLNQALTAGRVVYDELKNICVWNKTNAGMGSLYRSKSEFIPVFKCGKGAHINNVELGKYGRSRSNVWDYPGMNSFGPGRDESLAAHPTVKPAAMVADAILDVTRRKDIVLDCFGGSGTTLIAAERTGRYARLLEIDPLYCDVIVRRWQKATGKQAIHAESGRTFDDIAAWKHSVILAARQSALSKLQQVGDA